MMRQILCFVTLASMLITGCSNIDEDMAPVEGYVTLDGQPLPNAEVIFQPESGERKSNAMTDEDGYYYLKYTFKKDGAKVGKHRVMITTYTERAADGIGAGSPELLGVQYNTETTLTAEVKPGNNDIPFDLKSGGTIADRTDFDEDAEIEGDMEPTTGAAAE